MNTHDIPLRPPAPTNNAGAALRWVHEKQTSRLAMQNVCQVHTAPEDPTNTLVAPIRAANLGPRRCSFAKPKAFKSLTGEHVQTDVHSGIDVKTWLSG